MVSKKKYTLMGQVFLSYLINLGSEGGQMIILGFSQIRLNNLSINWTRKYTDKLVKAL